MPAVSHSSAPPPLPSYSSHSDFHAQPKLIKTLLSLKKKGGVCVEYFLAAAASVSRQVVFKLSLIESSRVLWLSFPRCRRAPARRHFQARAVRRSLLAMTSGTLASILPCHLLLVAHGWAHGAQGPGPPAEPSLGMLGQIVVGHTKTIVGPCGKSGGESWGGGVLRGHAITMTNLCVEGCHPSLTPFLIHWDGYTQSLPLRTSLSSEQGFLGNVDLNPHVEHTAGTCPWSKPSPNHRNVSYLTIPGACRTQLMLYSLRHLLLGCSSKHKKATWLMISTWEQTSVSTQYRMHKQLVTSKGCKQGKGLLGGYHCFDSKILCFTNKNKICPTIKKKEKHKHVRQPSQFCTCFHPPGSFPVSHKAFLPFMLSPWPLFPSSWRCGNIWFCQAEKLWCTPNLIY